MSIEKILQDFDKQFPCIEQHCNDNGTISTCNQDGDVEPQQCQYCYENRLPIKEFIKNAEQQIREELFSDEKIEGISEKIMKVAYYNHKIGDYIRWSSIYEILKEELVK